MNAILTKLVNELPNSENWFITVFVQLGCVEVQMDCPHPWKWECDDNKTVEDNLLNAFLFAKEHSNEPTTS